MAEIFEMKCPECDETIKIPMEEFVDVSQDPEKKPKIIEGEFFLNICPNCGCRIMVEYPVMYMDPTCKLNVYMEPGHDEDLLEQLNSLDVPEDETDSEAIYRLTDCGLGLMEKILICDGGRDDRIIELYKAAIWEQVKEDWPDLEYGDMIYTKIGDEECFAVWPATNEKGEKMVVSFSADFYDYLEDSYLNTLHIPPGIYAEVDQYWIRDRFDFDEEDDLNTDPEN